VRIGVVGLVWFGEIHCETVIGVPPPNRQRYARERPIA
jgi:hypothetical protein